ncbi:hypothetical protein D9757_008515 [Collybiopsis confluens]|uniref:Heat shock factor binding protein 1 n=1 Tax=Collybiopsis confluens TaxID=2823264 RepID=A0A8H5H2M6_9AGAR|nr:hypothetical protein D9757_008515 [Collybiopsis confluens]
MASTAQPLKPTKSSTEGDTAKVSTSSLGAQNISSPHELTAFVETLLEQLDSKFDEMSTQILDRMTQMSTRVDALEAAIQDIINGDVPPSPSPNPGTPGGMRRSESGL